MTDHRTTRRGFVARLAGALGALVVLPRFTNAEPVPSTAIAAEAEEHWRLTRRTNGWSTYDIVDRWRRGPDGRLVGNAVIYDGSGLFTSWHWEHAFVGGDEGPDVTMMLGADLDRLPRLPEHRTMAIAEGRGPIGDAEIASMRANWNECYRVVLDDVVIHPWR